ncbi:homocysteine S-methyltransferase [Lacticaseibacillus baoqingensis]|uniref:Homocysteine S-methyltransferase n=1 Tax=Lacticaseibacillus baoqingensis TaxID=2486013 RepID=A0ABW4E6A3_9LACO|nr:homocysteine S-methyltransferase [Lacticaseibacillus baoqingensis]
MSKLNALLQRQTVVINDGAMATELEKAGVPTNNALWSAMALLTDPQAIRAVHRSYFEAGANIATTNSYQANPQAFVKLGLSENAADHLIQQTVTLAKEARSAYLAAHPQRADELLIAGSIGPYGAYLADGSEYTGAYTLTQAQYQAFHRRRMQLLAASGSDFFAFETMPNLQELTALVHLLENEFPTMTAWASLSVGDAHDQLCDGTALEAVCQLLNESPQIEAIGINCTAMTNVAQTLAVLRPLTHKPLVVYPNNGDHYDPSDKTWHVTPNAPSFAALAPQWQQAGAKIIGGCCRTTPADIRAIVKSCQG